MKSYMYVSFAKLYLKFGLLSFYFNIFVCYFLVSTPVSASRVGVSGIDVSLTQSQNMNVNTNSSGKTLRI